MNIKDKLKIVQKISGSTQNGLAILLGVSFPTLNSWINGKSIPRKSVQQKIESLYFKLTGIHSKADDNLLLAKKKIIAKKSHKNIFKLITDRPDLYDQFVLSLTYNTNSIEGSTLSESETADILFRNKALRNKSLTEQLEAKNHQAALHYLFRYLSVKKNPIDEDLILKLHSILMNGIRDDAGSYRRHGVRIVGANIPTANYLKVPFLMDGLIKIVNSKTDDIILRVSEAHAKFEQIHPFADGNGRIGRILINAMFVRANLPPAIIKQKRKQYYYSFLNKAQRNGDFGDFQDFLCDVIFESFYLIE
jgi:Fic family protein